MVGLGGRDFERQRNGTGMRCLDSFMCPVLFFIIRQLCHSALCIRSGQRHLPTQQRARDDGNIDNAYGPWTGTGIRIPRQEKRPFHLSIYVLFIIIPSSNVDAGPGLCRASDGTGEHAGSRSKGRRVSYQRRGPQASATSPKGEIGQKGRFGLGPTQNQTRQTRAGERDGANTQQDARMHARCLV